MPVSAGPALFFAAGPMAWQARQRLKTASPLEASWAPTGADSSAIAAIARHRLRISTPSLTFSHISKCRSRRQAKAACVDRRLAHLPLDVAQVQREATCEAA